VRRLLGALSEGCSSNTLISGQCAILDDEDDNGCDRVPVPSERFSTCSPAAALSECPKDAVSQATRIAATGAPRDCIITNACLRWQQQMDKDSHAATQTHAYSKHLEPKGQDEQRLTPLETQECTDHKYKYKYPDRDGSLSGGSWVSPPRSGPTSGCGTSDMSDAAAGGRNSDSPCSAASSLSTINSVTTTYYPPGPASRGAHNSCSGSVPPTAPFTASRPDADVCAADASTCAESDSGADADSDGSEEIDALAAADAGEQEVHSDSEEFGELDGLGHLTAPFNLLFGDTACAAAAAAAAEITAVAAPAATEAAGWHGRQQYESECASLYSGINSCMGSLPGGGLLEGSARRGALSLVENPRQGSDMSDDQLLELCDQIIGFKSSVLRDDIRRVSVVCLICAHAGLSF
jgi:hypothetical protein